jgi:Ca2+-binding RTX toxin-like protein
MLRLASRRRLFSLALLATLVACGKGGNDPSTSSTDTGSGGAGAGGQATTASGGQGGGGSAPVVIVPEDFEGIDVSAVPAGTAPAGCSAFDEGTGKLALTLGGEVTTLLLAAVGGVVQANGVDCATATGKKAAVSLVKAVVITGTDADESVIVDLAAGPFGAKLLTAGGGISVDLGGGKNHFAVRGSYGADKLHAGLLSGKNALDLDGDGAPDTFVTGVDAMTVSLGPGDDEFSAAGFAEATPLAIPVTVFGGDGNDTLQGGAGDDTLHGGAGDDLFLTAAAADGADSYDGGEGNDTVDYSKRSAAITVTLDDVVDDGEPGEHDDVQSTVETVIGGAGSDTLSCGEVGCTLRGGPGNDKLRGGPSDDTLYGDDGDDDLAGGAGSDMLDGGEGKNRLDGGEGDGDICLGSASDVVIACELY